MSDPGNDATLYHTLSMQASLITILQDRRVKTVSELEHLIRRYSEAAMWFTGEGELKSADCLNTVVNDLTDLLKQVKEGVL